MANDAVLSEPLRVFVYGTLQPGGTYWQSFCAGRVEQMCPAKILGHLYALNAGYPALVLAEPADWVYGCVLHLKDAHTLQGLDSLEGYDAYRPPVDNEYNRCSVDAYALTGAPLGKTWVYHMATDRVQALQGIFMHAGKWNEQMHATLAFPNAQLGD